MKMKCKYGYEDCEYHTCIRCNETLVKPYDKDTRLKEQYNQIKMLIKERDFLMKNILGWKKAFENEKLFSVANEMGNVLLKCKQIEQDLIVN